VGRKDEKEEVNIYWMT